MSSNGLKWYIAQTVVVNGHKFYGITLRYQKDPQPLREDLQKIFSLLAEKKIDPLIYRTFPLLDARQALELLAAGSVQGKIVLTGE